MKSFKLLYFRNVIYFIRSFSKFSTVFDILPEARVLIRHTMCGKYWKIFFVVIWFILSTSVIHGFNWKFRYEQLDTLGVRTQSSATKQPE